MSHKPTAFTQSQPKTAPDGGGGGGSGTGTGSGSHSISNAVGGTSAWARSTTSRSLTVDTSNTTNKNARGGAPSPRLRTHNQHPSTTTTTQASSPPTAAAATAAAASSSRSTPTTSSRAVAFSSSASAYSPPGRRAPRSTPTNTTTSGTTTTSTAVSATSPTSSSSSTNGLQRKQQQRATNDTNHINHTNTTNKTNTSHETSPLMTPVVPGSSGCCGGCRCGDACICREDLCACSEELCQCKAFQLMYSFNSTPTTPAASPVRTTNTNTTNSNTNSTHQHPKPTTLVVEMGIDGMTCSMCSNAVSAAVLAIPGVQSVDISLTTDTAVVVFIPDATTTIQGSNTNNSNNEPMVDRLVHAIEAIGYDVSNVNVAPNNNTDTDNTRPTYNTNTNSNNNNTDPDGVAQRWQQYRQRQSDKVQQRRAAVLWAAAGTLPILILTMILPHFAAFHSAWLHRPVRLPFWQDKTMDLESLIVWILATPVQFVCGWDFYKMAWYGFINQRAGMDLLVALGTTASYGYALNGAWNSSNDDDGNNSNSSNNNTTAAHFFETSAILILFVLIGKWMQAVVVRQTSEALTQLMQLQCPTAIKITRHRIGGNDKAQHRKETPFNPLVDAYQEQVVDIQLVSAGDIVKIIRGASIPADGRILCGEIAVDESMMTGESLPVLKTNGSIVLGGTICVEGDNSSESSTGAAFVQVTGVGSSTALAQIVQLVQQAQTRAVPIQSFADQVSAIFVPTVCLISLLTYLVWYALCSTNVVPVSWYRDELGEDAITFSLKFAIACLVISCPCALGLATPTAVMVGTGVGAKCGVLMKGGEALEIASKVNVVVFDKTGTLTKGSPVITDAFYFAEYRDGQARQDYLLWLLGSLERNSEHPLARAIVKYAFDSLGDALDENPFVHPTEFRAVTGRGASGVLLGKISIAVGNRVFASMMGIVLSAEANDAMTMLEDDGKTAILAVVDGKICCVLGVSDEVKSDAAASIYYLRDVLKVDVWMVTGDNFRTATAVGRLLSIPPNRIVAEALPAAKLEKIRELQAEGRSVCMVGDGINDSAALAQADVGIGMGTGTEIATEAADMILVKAHVSDVCTALHLSRSIFRRIQWNLLLSLVYNCFGIPVAAGVFYSLVRTRLPPTVAAVAMTLSSISVVVSSLSLQLYRPPKVTERFHHQRPISLSSRGPVTTVSDDMRASLLSSDHFEPCDSSSHENNQASRLSEERYTV